MMAWRFKASVGAGAIGLYSVPTPESADDAPLTDPLNNLSRVIFHPALRYPGRVNVFSGTTIVSSTDNGVVKNLVPHGRGARPMMVATMTLPNGTVVPWGGSVPIKQGVVGAGTSTGHEGEPTSGSVWLTLGADETYVKAYVTIFGNGVISWPVTVNWNVHVFDRLFGTALQDTGPTRFAISGADVEFQTPRGTFTSAKRYLRSGSDFTLAFGKTIAMQYYNFARPSPSSLREIGATWRYASGTGYNVASERVYYGNNLTADYAVTAPTPGTEGVKF